MKEGITFLGIILATAGFVFFGSKTDFRKGNPTSNPTSATGNNIEDEKMDKFGIAKLYPDLPRGRQWFSKWDNGQVRVLRSGERDAFDHEFIARGNGTINLSGNGLAVISGSFPRMYVYDRDKKQKWRDVEITVYAKRVSETGNPSSQGFVIGARSEHQDADEANPCLGRTYYGRILYDGRAVFQKEVIHEGAYSVNMPSENSKAMWNTSGGTLPKNVWVGIKFVVRNTADQKGAILELYRDITDGENGGSWEKLVEYTDSGSWSQTDSGVDVAARCGYSAGKVLTDPGVSVFIRNDMVREAQYKLFSIREI